MAIQNLENSLGSGATNSLIAGSPVIETRRLLLRSLHEDDIADLVRLANNLSVASMLGSMPHPYFPADAKEFLERMNSDQNNGSVYAVTKKDGGQFMGCCGLHEDSERFEFPFMGYWIGEPFWNKGFATEAARALVDLYFKVTDRDELMMSCRRDNAPSRAVIIKCGGRYWKSGEAYNKALGQLHKLEHFRLTRASWMAAAFGK
ncbi:MAG: GNAT family N-acetyltransferase [Rhizobiaceae bacterium]